MQIITETIISKPRAAVWEVAGTQFGNAYLWASALDYSVGHGAAIAGPVCEARTCDVQGMGRINEKLREFDPANFTLAYEVIEGFPFFVKRGLNRWQLLPEGDNRTRLRSTATVETKGFVGLMMAPMMKMQVSGIMRRTLEELKFYVENGRPHPRKQKTLASRKMTRAAA